MKIDIKAIYGIVGFTGRYFYVRKEVLCVLQNFVDVNENDLTDLNFISHLYKQFVVVGSPGTGKSCILALLCFYIAVEKDQSVVWHRYDDTGNEFTTTRLFYKGKHYVWIDASGDMYTLLKSLADSNWCVSLDGVDENTMKYKNWRMKYSILATSVRFKPKTDDTEMHPCVSWFTTRPPSDEMFGTSLEERGHRKSV
ncbi:Crinkler (CRN) [Phytophthora megakarya]|uniref:Crinkler (CRN) n=1 Tax=Phytophthora megakarya TaxID=4795 RepID=A0A225WIP8_9STRA|nr:Crinkler (CRN) [Phytophthora megakarya]